jgi:hypothetical protein
VRGDAGLAPTQDGVQAVLAATCVAARAGLPFVAGARRVVEIGAACALQQVAADDRGIAQLSGSAGEQRFGDRREALAEGRVMGAVGVAHTRADVHPARSIKSGVPLGRG